MCCVTNLKITSLKWFHWASIKLSAGWWCSWDHRREFTTVFSSFLTLSRRLPVSCLPSSSKLMARQVFFTSPFSVKSLWFQYAVWCLRVSPISSSWFKCLKSTLHIKTPLLCQHLSIVKVSGIWGMDIIAGYCSAYYRHHKAFVRNKWNNTTGEVFMHCLYKVFSKCYSREYI